MEILVYEPVVLVCKVKGILQLLDEFGCWTLCNRSYFV